MTFNNLVPDGLSQESAYVPRVFGFRVHPSARQRNANSSIASVAGNASVSLSTNVAAKKPSNVSTTIPGGGTGNGVTMDNYNDDSNNISDKVVASKPAVASTDGKGKRIKRGKSKSEDSGGSSRRKSKNGGDNDESASSRSKRQKRP
jgi:hypothetical protein